ncbi:hypothetical protein NP233_g3868 [Leucocoprinus birnbaumii]|uniref:ATP-dependent DNA helicase n=1 Tax=Leucocoprinus birnbaumii TaxID=56174 RepID=A0AAD5YY21_9AGAR|nr:hypothetical protein NP233_g3868 [Leucocoprinus birnbaumii]
MTTPGPSALTFHNGELLEPTIRCLTIKEIVALVPNRGDLRSAERRRRPLLLQAVTELPPAVQDIIRDAARRKTEAVLAGLSNTIAPPSTVMNQNNNALPNDYKYMDPPSSDTIKACEDMFYNRTSNAYLDEELANIPNLELLAPAQGHPAHFLFQGALIHGPAIKAEDKTFLCHECLGFLKRKVLPPLSLANNLFIGEVPFPLRLLKLAEQIMVARYYAAAFIIKLYPRDPRARHWDHNMFMSGLKGNVATYPLKPEDVAHYLDPMTLPPRPGILASTLCVSFVGPAGKPDKFFPDAVYVRRDRVRDALMWLKANNPLYADITISEENLQLLPENGVPEAIRYGARLTTNSAFRAQEHDGYVPEEGINEEDMETFAIPGVSGVSDDEGDEFDAPMEPAVVPLRVSSVVDATGTQLTDQAISASALANLAGASEQLRIHRGSAFVNEYPRLDADGVRTVGVPDNANHLLGTFPWLFPYGTGGFEVDRPTVVSYERHAKWALMYGDGRFRRDHYFMPMVFGVLRKRQMARASSLEMSKAAFLCHRNLLAQLKPADFEIASQEEERGVPFSNPAIRVLRSSMNSALAKVPYTDASLKQIRSKVWGTVVVHGPPSIWFTLNPSDLQNPVAQLFVGEDINLDDFDKSLGPSSMEQVDFRERVSSFIGSVVHADIGGLDTEGVLAIPAEPDVAFSRPTNPASQNYDAERTKREHSLACNVQLHTCSTYTCLQKRNGVTACKRGAPFDCADEAWVNEDGQWGPKRHCARINGYNPSVLVSIGSNNDMKIVTHGPETKDATFYISDYQTKGQGTASHNISALLGDRIRYHIIEEQENVDIADSTKKLLTRCLNTLNRLQEFGGPQIASSLLGLSDRYISHQYAPVYLDSMHSALQQQSPDLKLWAGPSRDNEKLVFIHDEVELRDQLRDYQYRGDALEMFSLYEFLVDTHEGKPLPGGNDRADEEEEHAAMMLMLFRPWRNLSDLKEPFDTYLSEYMTFIESCPPITRRYIDNIQYYHQGMDRRTERRAEKASEPIVPLSTSQRERMDREERQMVVLDQQSEGEVTAHDLDLARRGRNNAKLEAFGLIALNIGRRQGLFDVRDPVSEIDLVVDRQMDTEEEEKTLHWAAKLQKITREPTTVATPHPIAEGLRGSQLNSGEPQSLTTSAARIEVVDRPHRTRSTRAGLRELKDDQKLVHDIVESQLLKHLNNEPTDQLLLLVQGEGSTGKTRLIQEVAATYKEHGAENDLARTATSGVAATLINGETLHSWLGLGVVTPTGNQWMNRGSVKTYNLRKRKIGGKRLLIIDECSMLTSRLLAATSQLVDYIRSRDDNEGKTAGLAFGGLDVILFGDFHQFPPVGRSGRALYAEPKTDQDILGHQIFLQFKTVLFLRDQMRVEDEEWLQFLRRLRVGGCNAGDMELLEGISLMASDVEKPDWNKYPWSEAVLITPRRAVRDMWNQEKLKMHCQKKGVVQYIVRANDTVNGEEPTMAQRLGIIQNTPEDFSLEEFIAIAVGAVVMIEVNVATDAGIANGTRGVIEEIILDGRDAGVEVNTDGTCSLSYPPAVIWFRPEIPTPHLFDPRRPGLVPITPWEMGFSFETKTMGRLRVRRQQLPITLAYAFTDYKSQGQTLPAVIVDLAPPPGQGGHLTNFNAYVSLSRVKSRAVIRILREFQESLFTTPPAQSLAYEDQRLAKYAAEEYRSQSVSTFLLLNMSSNAQTALNNNSGEFGFLGSYPQDNHPFTWQLNYPLDHVVNSVSPDEPQRLSVIGNLITSLSHLDPLGTFGDECALLAKAEYKTVISVSSVQPLFNSWMRSAREQSDVAFKSLNAEADPTKWECALTSDEREKVQGVISQGMEWAGLPAFERGNGPIDIWSDVGRMNNRTVAVEFTMSHSNVFEDDDFIGMLEKLTVEY